MGREEGLERIDGGCQPFYSKLAKLEFPTYSGDDSTEWFNRVDQFFDYQGMTVDQKVQLAFIHLEGKAN